MRSLLILCILFSLIGDTLYSQSTGALKKSDVRKLPKLELLKGNQDYPNSYFMKINGDSLTVMVEMKDDYKGVFFDENKVNINDFNKLKISDRKNRIRNSLFTSLAVGAGTFFIVKKAVADDADTFNPFPTTEQKDNGVLQGILSGALAGGIGFLISQNIFSIKIDLNMDKEKAKSVLSEMSTY